MAKKSQPIFADAHEKLLIRIKEHQQLKKKRLKEKLMLDKVEKAISRIKILRSFGKGKGYYVEMSRELAGGVKHTNIKKFSANLITDMNFLDGTEIWYDPTTKQCKVLINGIVKPFENLRGGMTHNGNFRQTHVKNPNTGKFEPKTVPVMVNTVFVYDTGKIYDNIYERLAQYTFKFEESAFKANK